MAAFAAVATPQGRDAHNPFPLLRMVGTFISYDQLMPLVRLQYSRLLGRPIMEPRAPLDHFMGSVLGGIYIEEVLHINAWVVGHTQLARGWARTGTWSQDEAYRRNTRELFWRVELRDVHYGDEVFFDAWVARYGGEWPYIGPGRVHPGLERLYAAYRAFDDLIDEHADAVEQGILGVNRGHRS